MTRTRFLLAGLSVVAWSGLAGQTGQLAHFVSGRVTFVQGGVRHEWPLLDPGYLSVNDLTHDTTLTLNYVPIDEGEATSFGLVYMAGKGAGQHVTIGVRYGTGNPADASYEWTSLLDGPPRCAFKLTRVSAPAVEGSGTCSAGAFGAGPSAVTQFAFSATPTAAPGALAPAVAWGPLAHPPTTLVQIPVFAGAARTRPPSDCGEEATGPNHRYYLAAAPIEDVVRFYRQKLTPREVGQDDDAYQVASEGLKPGGATSVFLKVLSYEFGAFGPLAGPTKAAVTKRPPYRAGQWLVRALFNWAQKNRDGTGTALLVTLEDVVQPQGANALELRNTGTLIHIGTSELETESEAEVADEPAAVEPAPEPQEEHPPLPEPSAAQLGVPKYPGARYDARMSSQMSSDQQRFYVFTTGDPVPQAVAFYERATGKKGQPAPDGQAVAIAVRGTMPWPELGVVIQPRLPQYPASVKAVITVLGGTPNR